MKRFATVAALMLASCSAAGPAAAAADWEPGIYVRGVFSYVGQRQTDLNDIISADEGVLQSFGAPVNFDRFGGTPEFGGEAGFRFAESFSIGLSIMHQSKTITNGFADDSGSYGDRMRTSFTEVTANFTFWPPTAPGVFLGLQVGGGSGTFTEDFALRDFNDSSNDALFTGKWKGSGAVFGIFAGYQTQFSNTAFLFGRLGYGFRKIGKFDGTLTDLVYDIQYTGAYQNNSGEAVEFDFSGVQATIGVGVPLGLHR